jgi:hypothetical protein
VPIRSLGYVVLAHRNLAQLERLIRAIHHPDDAIVIHTDARLSSLEVAALGRRLNELGNVDLFSEVKCRWGGYSVSEAIFRSYRRLIAKDKPIGYCTLLSGSDYPARPRGELIDYLQDNDEKQFVEIWWQGDAAAVPHDFRNRYTAYWPYERLVSSNATRRRSLAIQRLLGIDRALPCGLQPVFGSTWMTLSLGAIRSLLESLERPPIESFFRKTALADEMLPHMLLRQSRYWPAVTGRNLHFIATGPDGRFPKLLRASDFDAIKRSQAFFCRKIEYGQDEGLCDLLDAHLRG